MATKTRAQLQALWISGYTPTEANYDDVWDSFFNITDDDTDSITEGTNKFFTSGTSTSSTVTFANYFTYHSAAGGGGLSGNFTVDLTSAKIGALAIFRSNNSSSPTITMVGGTLRQEVTLSTNYVNSSDNEIWLLASQDANGDKFAFLSIKEKAITNYGCFYVDAGAMIASTTTGGTALTEETSTNVVDVDYFTHSVSSEESVNFAFSLPLDYDSSGSLKAKFFWDAASGSSGNAVWGISLKGVPNDVAYGSAFGTEVTSTADTLIAVGDNHVTDATAAITPSNTPGAGDLVLAQVVLKTSSTLTPGPARLKGVLFQYQISNTAVAAW